MKRDCPGKTCKLLVVSLYRPNVVYRKVLIPNLSKSFVVEYEFYSFTRLTKRNAIVGSLAGIEPGSYIFMHISVCVLYMIK